MVLVSAKLLLDLALYLLLLNLLKDEFVGKFIHLVYLVAYVRWGSELEDLGVEVGDFRLDVVK